MAVYFIRPIGMLGPVKIGCSRWPENRLDALSAWSPYPLEIVATIEDGDMDLERRLHGLFAASHTHREWFTASDALMRLIDRLAAGEAIETLIDMSQPIGPFRVRKGRSYSESQRIAVGYRFRLARARRPFWEPNWKPRRFFPRDVDDIIDAMQAGTMPTTEQRALLDAIIANPGAHVVTSEERWPAKPKRARAA